MFTFNDLIKLDPAGVQTLIRTIENDKMILTLNRGSYEIKTCFYYNMSELPSKLMKEDMPAVGPVRLSAVESAQICMI